MRRTSNAVSGQGQKLRLQAGCADKGSMVSVVPQADSKAVRRHKREDGQALVEFALILPLFLMIVVGIIQFGVGLNFWLDMQRIANQGARWAVVNEYPGCPRSGPNTPCTPSLQQYLAESEVARGENLNVHICFPSGGTVGNPVRVKITQPLNFLSVVTFFTPGSGLNIDLTAEATMRLEQAPGRYTADPDTAEPGPC